MIFLIVAAGMQAFLSLYFFQKAAVERENLKIENYIRFASGFFSDAYNKYYQTDFEKFAEAARNLIGAAPAVDYAQMIDIKGRVLFDTRYLRAKQNEKIEIFVEEELLENATSSKPFYVREESGLYKAILMPVLEELGFHRYSLVYRISYKTLEDQAAASLREFLKVLAIFLISFFVVGMMFIFGLLKPLSNLDQGIRIINQGNLDYKLKTEGGDEIANIALGFNKMAQDLKHAFLKAQKVSALEDELKGKEKDLSEKLQDVQNKTAEIEQFKEALLNVSEDAGNSRDLALKERDKTLAIINNFADALIVLGARKDVLLVNPQAEKFFAVKSADAVNKIFSALRGNEALNKAVEFINKAETHFLRKELEVNENFILEISAIPMRGLSKDNAERLVIFHDITREKLIEKTKSEFVSIAAHQLRTPLSAIKWIFGMMVEGDWGKLLPEQKEYLQKGYASTERLIRVVNDILNVSRIEEGRFVQKLEMAQIEEIARAVYIQHQNIAETKKINFTYKKPEQKTHQIFVDHEQIRMVMENLVENAMNYTTEGGRVELSVAEDKEKREVSVCVSDTGIGIPKAQESRIFSKFFRSSNAMRMETSGSGLGLFVTKNIVENHKGRIWFESEENKGTKFYFVLPFSKD